MKDSEKEILTGRLYRSFLKQADEEFEKAGADPDDAVLIISFAVTRILRNTISAQIKEEHRLAFAAGMTDAIKGDLLDYLKGDG